MRFEPNEIIKWIPMNVSCQIKSKQEELEEKNLRGIGPK